MVLDKKCPKRYSNYGRACGGVGMEREKKSLGQLFLGSLRRVLGPKIFKRARTLVSVCVWVRQNRAFARIQRAAEAQI